MSQQGIQRLHKEHKKLIKSPIEGVEATPTPDDIYTWYYIITGPKDTPFAGGRYFGKVVFPKEYPYAPPAVYMYTPNGYFETTKKVCMSMTDLHPETWNPLWGISAILTGLISFMSERMPTMFTGATTNEEKEYLSRASMAYNITDPLFQKYFPQYIPENVPVSKISNEKLRQLELKDGVITYDMKTNQIQDINYVPNKVDNTSNFQKLINSSLRTAKKDGNDDDDDDNDDNKDGEGKVEKDEKSYGELFSMLSEILLEKLGLRTSDGDEEEEQAAINASTEKEKERENEMETDADMETDANIDTNTNINTSTNLSRRGTTTTTTTTTTTPNEGFQRDLEFEKKLQKRLSSNDKSSQHDKYLCITLVLFLFGLFICISVYLLMSIFSGVSSLLGF